ncbi:hypothetical protein EYZ11_010186 [Aspergillus tanneri]|uniref:Uncharacterized protein n=1 Tax=Aspergillus tanneri TaxID=1220188 RepID=A0A4S3J6I5_9EURO|nr:hypothetical protein EYZ11_010186 [Aspergillus tanneri]
MVVTPQISEAFSATSHKLAKTPFKDLNSENKTPPLEVSSPLDSPSRTPRSTQRSINKIYKYLDSENKITPGFQRRIKRALTRSIATSNLLPVQRELTTAIGYKEQREQPKTRQQISSTGALESRHAKRKIKDRAAQERLTQARREKKQADKQAEQQLKNEEELAKKRSGEILPPDNPVDLLFWYDTVGDPV